MNRKHVFAIIVGCCLILLMLPAARSAAPKYTAIRGGTVLTMAGKPIPNGTVLIKDDKIEAVGADVKVPSGATVVEASGKYVMPGLIDAMTYYGIRPFDLNDTSNPITPQNRIIQAFYPFGEFFAGNGRIAPDKEILSGGVTTVYIAPGDKQVIGGQGAVVKTFGPSLDGMVVREPAAIDMTIGDTAKGGGTGAAAKSPVTRMNIAALIRKTLIDAQEYDRNLKAHLDKPEEERKKSARPPQDANLEAMGKLLRRELPARVEADLVDDIRTAIRIADEFNLNLVVDSGLSAYALRDVLAEKKIPVVLGPTSHPFIIGGEISITPELARILDEHNAAYLAKAGVKIAMASFGFGFGQLGKAVQGKWLLLEAGLATGFDLSDDDALKALTINAAEILGVANRVGSLEPGKDADLIILDGPPLSVKTWVEQTYIDGALVYTRKKQN
jgi:imidazolonepropionase-like amidohydrolase